MEPRRSQAARSQAARDQIAQAALTVFALKGYASSSMDDICLAAGCSKGGLYHHFRNKPAVLAGVIDRLASLDALLPPFAGEGAAPAAIGRVLIDVWAEASRDPGLGDQLRAGYRRSSSGGFELADLLNIGALVQLLTRGEDVDAERVAARLGIERAA
jgi:AcrR family transcriptional regulator